MFIYPFIALLVLCFYQDVRFRGIHWVVFPLLLVNSIMVNQTLQMMDIIYNLSFIAVCMVGLTLYVSLKQGSMINITKGFFSWGDIMFLIAVTPLFSFQTFLLFFTIGTCLTLVFHLIASLIARQKTIPYAGYMSIVVVLFISMEDQILNLLMGLYG